MIYSQKSFSIILLSLLLVSFGFATEQGWTESWLKYLNIAKEIDQIVQLSTIFGLLGLGGGLLILIRPARPGKPDYYLSLIPGIVFIMFLAMIVRWGATPAVEILSKSIGPVWGSVHDDRALIHNVLGLNHIFLGILLGIIVANFFGIPRWAITGVGSSRLALKIGVILLGATYSFKEFRHLGPQALLIIALFVFGTIAAVLWYGRRQRLPNSMTGVLSAGMGVCGVSATVAAAPVVQARSIEIAYTIGTILLWGLVCMFVFPIIGRLLELTPTQFGAWAGTGILNSAQVTAAALSFQPDELDTVKVAEVFNITRVLFLPAIVLWLAIWYVHKEQVKDAYIDMGQVVIDKFPIFVLGFVTLFILSSNGMFAPKNHYNGKYFDSRLVAPKHLLTEEEKLTLEQDLENVNLSRRKEAYNRLITKGKIATESDEIQIKGMLKSDRLKESTKKVLEKSTKVVRHTSPRVKKIKEIIDWCFAFGLVGLGMQITFGAMRQAGGQPLVVGIAIGTLKAVGSLILILLLIESSV